MVKRIEESSTHINTTLRSWGDEEEPEETEKGAAREVGGKQTFLHGIFSGDFYMKLFSL